jgi:26S proteasome non-ATPase regulatory subunit 9
MSASDREALKALILQKDDLERQIVEISEALQASNMGGASGALVDGEGFPRADIDVHTTRTLRNKLAHLNTDHKALMARIEAGLQGAFPAVGGSAPPRVSAPRPVDISPVAPAVSAATGTTPAAVAASTGPSPMEVVADDEPLDPFAEIDEVFAEGPAAAAGVLVGDLLLKFGGVHARNHDGLKALARLTQRSVGDSIPLLVLRGCDGGGPQEQQQRVRLQLMPRRWAGQGLLGFHLKPL